MTVMTPYRTSRRIWQRASLVAIIGILGACGGSDDATPEPAPVSESAPAEVADEPSEASDAAAVAESTPEPEPEAPASAGGAGSATLTLDNGESYEFSVLCSLEPQIAAGSEILFTATSYDDIGLDITQFGNEGPVTDTASISVYDDSYNTLWEASSMFEAFGGSIALSLDGSTINGTGSFFPAGDIAAAPVDGTVVANC